MIVPYLDDFLIFFAQDQQKLERDSSLVLQTLQRLGWKINEEKSSLVPFRSLTFLGYQIDAANQENFRRGVWQPEEAYRSSNYRELLAIGKAM